MTEPDPTPRRGRRARALSPEESMARTAEQASVPGVRGAVAPPGADAPVPALRKFGRRARIIEISDDSAPDLTRDADGVELGELPVTEAPDPRPAPRFDGKVLHRPERSGGRPLLWLVWALLAIALTVLVVLLLTGVLGTDAAAALDAAP
ncbi:hypothetical protein [Brachybacterium sp. UNK5269]|uniref:hypothetical protein n=1 Tax=Brachybacterium sp. UNK5269 TaxID=3408576 RepID=UPI003BB1D64B